MSVIEVERRRELELLPAPEGPYLVGVAPCGCVVSAALDAPGYAQATGDHAARAIRAGQRLERRESLPTHGFLGPGCPGCLRDPAARGGQ